VEERGDHLATRPAPKQVIRILVTWAENKFTWQPIIEQQFSIFATNCQGREPELQERWSAEERGWWKN